MEHKALLEHIAADLEGDLSEERLLEVRGVFALACLLPANIIMNAITPGLKLATGSFAFLVKQVYDKLAKSGTHYSGSEKTAIEIAKNAAIDALKSSNKSEFIPAVNVFVGMYYDTMSIIEFQRNAQDTRNQTIEAQRQLRWQVSKLNREIMLNETRINHIVEQAIFKMNVA
ncbi:hypothetical protein M5E06_32805 [Azospirillum sp. A1-3]|uniref:hypothetical protein n=1 Tax=Azospirillum sp. A1-3 TaxID=185874 RepID=UPI002076EA7F|nr:hypothetical protein [Azospirillum sp. A1-3]MCM8738868.1 hypothetical protein [Azospirillum sp. A1-3]